VIIIVRLVPSTRQIEMLSIPRDTYVPIPAPAARTGSTPLSTPAGLLVQTIQQDFGIPVNHVVVANFLGFEGMVNALGASLSTFRTRFAIRTPVSM